MRSECYEVTGCAGSQRYVSKGEFNSMPEARQAARERNQRNADGLGLSFRDYVKRSSGDEGWNVAGKSGFDGHRLG